MSEQPICAHGFNSTICVAPAGHAGAHVTSNERFPHGLAIITSLELRGPALPAPEPPRLNDMSVEDILDYYGVPPGGDPWHRINELGQMYRRALQKSGASALELLRRVVEVDHGADGLHGTIAAAKELLARAALPAEHAPPPVTHDVLVDAVFTVAGQAEMKERSPSIHWLRTFATRLGCEIEIAWTKRSDLSFPAVSEALERLRELDNVAFDREGVRELSAEILARWLTERREFGSRPALAGSAETSDVWLRDLLNEAASHLEAGCFNSYGVALLAKRIRAALSGDQGAKP